MSSCSDRSLSDSSEDSENEKKKRVANWLQEYKESGGKINETITYRVTEDFRIEIESLRNKYAYDSHKNPLKHKITNLFYENPFDKED